MIPSIIETSLKGKEKAYLSTYLRMKHPAIVTDPHTSEALGRRIVKACQGERIRDIGFDASPEATLETAEVVQSRAAGCDAMIAVGSGTINDLCKYAAHQLGIPYVVFPTAPSMNGYVSGTASLVVSGEWRVASERHPLPNPPPEGGGDSTGFGVRTVPYSRDGSLSLQGEGWGEGERLTTHHSLLTTKQSLPASPPLAVFCDLEVLAAAPKRLILSGLGDSLCRSTAQADWLLSHVLLGTKYDEKPFGMLKPFEQKLFDHAGQLPSGNLETIELLMRTLLASGEGMRLADGSYPASQGEHMIAHMMEFLQMMDDRNQMIDNSNIRHPSFNIRWALAHHGEQIGVTTLTMAEMQEKILDSETAPRVRTIEIHSEAMLKKVPNSDAENHINRKLEQHWHVWRKRIQDITLPAARLKHVLLSAGAPADPAQIGWDEATYTEAVRLARYTRERFTFLDLCENVPGCA